MSFPMGGYRLRTAPGAGLGSDAAVSRTCSGGLAPGRRIALPTSPCIRTGSGRKHGAP